jgi:uncharacterized coiled-coil DUF342 family protein
MEVEHMPFRLKRIFARKPVPESDTPDVVHEHINPTVLLPQIRASLDTLRATQDELSQRERLLLDEASYFYEQLKGSANALADVRREQVETSEKIDKLLEAVRVLEGQQAGERSLSHGDPARGEALVAHAEA